MNDEQVMRALFRAEYNQKKVSSSNPPPAVAALFDKLVRTKRARLAEFGITDADYRKFVETYWLIHESDEIEAECYRSCLTLMRQIQAYQKEHGGDLPNSECVYMKHGTTCGPLCPKFERTSDAQETNFTHFCDIDTGEPYEVRELTDEELGQ